MMIPIKQRGTLIQVTGQESALSVPWITSVDISIPRRSFVEPLPEGDRYLGFIFAAAPSPSDAEEAVREAHRRLTIEIEPSPTSSD